MHVKEPLVKGFLMSGKLSLSHEQQSDLASCAFTKMESVRSTINDVALKNLRNRFLDEFLICEVGYKVLLSNYKQAKGDKDTSCSKINVRQLRAVLKFAEINFSEADIKTLFYVRNCKSGKLQAKGVRNALSHDADERAIQELIERYDEFTR